jgi:deazaflavin-dependent oxidoreductase (nitroreductase family)
MPQSQGVQPLEEQVRQALISGRTIDITTTGRKSGHPRRLEIWFHNLDGEIYITGTPRKRDWYANLLADPAFTFHLKEQVIADLQARATPIVDPRDRRAIFTRILGNLGESSDLEAWLAGSPLVRVSFPEADN